VENTPHADLGTSLRRRGVARGELVGLVISPEPGPRLGVATAAAGWAIAASDLAEVGRADEVLRPRWAVWSGQTAARLAACGVRLATCWDITAAHRLLFGGWRADPGFAWARLRGLAADTMPAAGPPDLFGLSGSEDGDADDPVSPDG
jgi:DNA polymerase-1